MRSTKNFPKPSAKALLLKRLESLQRKLGEEGLDLCLIDHPVDLLYYTGLKVSAGYMVVSSTQAALFVDNRYIQIAREKAPMQAILEAPSALETYLLGSQGKKMGCDGSRIAYEQYIKLKKRLRPLKISLLSTSSFFRDLRTVKDRHEIEKMRKSASLAYEGFLYIRSLLTVGITEREVAKKFELFCLKKGADHLSFAPIIAFGARSAMPHYRPQEIPLKAGDLVLVDIGVVLDQYHSDMTRVLFFHTQSPFFKRVYQVVLEAHQAALALCQPGVSVASLDRAAREVMREAEMEENFLHSLGHGIGLETHEYPRIKSPGKEEKVLLESGMVVTVEPGLYFPGKGGIRYEDTVVVTERGYENLYPEMKSSSLLIKRT